MRYLCTIYNRDFAFGGPKSVLVGTATVRGRNLREAAARAYVYCVGHKRARILREQIKAPRAAVAGETDVQAIAVSLRKTSTRFGNRYLLDNMVEGWDIHDEPATSPSSPRPEPRLQRARLPHPVLLHFLQRPSSN